MVDVEGIVLNTIDYSETSKIINVITKEYGLIGIMAKGVRQLKSETRALCERLVYAKFNIYYKEGKLSILKSGDIIDNFKNIKKDIIKISYASFLLELAGQVIKQNDNVDIYNILISGLKKINEGYDAMTIMNIVELKYLDYLGVMPVIDSCSKCGSKEYITTLSSKVGGYVCGRCLTKEKIVSDKTIKLVRMFYYVDIDKISKLEVSKEVIREINKFLDEYYDAYTGLYLNSKQFISNLDKLND